MSLLPAGAGPASAQPGSPAERPVVVEHGDPGCSKNKRIEVRTGRISDPTEDKVTTVVVSLDGSCHPTITEWKTNQPLQATSSQPATEAQAATARPSSQPATTNGFEPDTIWGNFVRSSQTLQDPFNIDIAKLKWTHDRVWDDVVGVTRFKDTGEDNPNLSCAQRVGGEALELS